MGHFNGLDAVVQRNVRADDAQTDQRNGALSTGCRSFAWMFRAGCCGSAERGAIGVGESSRSTRGNQHIAIDPFESTHPNQPVSINASSLN
jgi:hypothetical protein